MTKSYNTFKDFVNGNFEFGEVVTLEKFLSFDEKTIHNIYCMYENEIEQCASKAVSTLICLNEGVYPLETHRFWAAVCSVMYFEGSSND